MDYTSILILIMVINGVFAVLLFLEARKRKGVVPMEEKIAYTKRLLTNLIPLALLLVTDAENTFGPATGPIKRAYVIDELYKRVPDEYKKYVTEENLDVIINGALERAVIFWAENPQIMKYTNWP